MVQEYITNWGCDGQFILPVIKEQFTKMEDLQIQMGLIDPVNRITSTNLFPNSHVRSNMFKLLVAAEAKLGTFFADPANLALAQLSPIRKFELLECFEQQCMKDNKGVKECGFKKELKEFNIQNGMFITSVRDVLEKYAKDNTLEEEKHQAVESVESK
jgi:hypothetical protein